MDQTVKHMSAQEAARTPLGGWAGNGAFVATAMITGIPVTLFGSDVYEYRALG